MLNQVDVVYRNHSHPNLPPNWYPAGTGYDPSDGLPRYKYAHRLPGLLGPDTADVKIKKGEKFFLG